MSDEISRGDVCRAVFIGDEMLVVQCAAEASRNGVEPVLLASSNPLVLDEAATLGVRTIDTRSLPLTDKTIRDLDGGADVLFSIAYQHIIDASVLAAVPTAINFHDGLLPRFGGLNVTTWSILANEPTHGVTWHVMEALADRGDIVHEVRFDVSADASAFSLNAQCYEAGLASFGEVARSVSSGLEVRPQPDGERKMYRRTERPVVFVDPAVPAAELHRSVRALDVGPRAFGVVGSVRIALGDQVLGVRATRLRPGTERPVGTLTATDEALCVQTADGVLEITALSASNGMAIDARTALAAAAVADGDVLATPSATMLEALTAADPGIARYERAWSTALIEQRGARPSMLDALVPSADRASAEVGVGVSRSEAATALAVWVDGVGDTGATSIAVTDAAARTALDALPGTRPALVDLSISDLGDDASSMGEHLVSRLDTALGRGVFLTDLVARIPDADGAELATSVSLHVGTEAPGASQGTAGLDFWLTDAGVLSASGSDASTVERVGGQVAGVLSMLRSAADMTTALALADVALLSDSDRALLRDVNQTDVDADLNVSIDELFRRRVATNGDAAALSCSGETLTYAELAGRVGAMTHVLADAGVAANDTVGIAVERSVDMVIGVLAAMTVGAHYLPLDPTYPADRLVQMVDDSGTEVVVARQGAEPDLTAVGRTVQFVAPISESTEAVQVEHGGDALAYVIYTSGSTGVPKGVELEHRQVVNFFVGMDAVIDTTEPGVWLAVTSLSFDISVLELLWTLTRGFHVVVAQSSGFVPVAAAATSSAPAVQRSTRPATMSMFYFAADEAQASNGYQLLMRTARWADQQGFEAVWTPERHFHDFGAPYPNPSVIGAALAVATENIGIRAGSVVIPLHSPIRIAEEWSIVDNLSGGRVGISFAAGWQPNDFVLNPPAYATARDSLPGLVETVQNLWRGQTVELPGHDGSPVAVATKPRPVQSELPVWLTSAGSPLSFERAGKLGHNVLTHLVGQTVERLAENIAVYRTAWSDAGHPGEGQVTLMLHTYLGTDGDATREIARGPLKGYLGTAVGLLKDLASSFPTFHRAGADADEAFRSLTDDEMSQLLDLATDRYLSTAGLFGTLDDASALAQSVVDIGVDELACLIDFGIDEQLVVEGLDLLGELHERLQSGQIDSVPAADVTAPAAAAPAAAPETFAGLVADYGVTHFQCTPSLASMILADPGDARGLASVQHMMVGGEAMPVALATELRSHLPGRLTNMYGPTETTIWSLVHDVDGADDVSIPIGTPIANTTVHVRDQHGRELPPGVRGELFIGGDGVARGYRDRPELNAERFPDGGDAGRIYATGDVVMLRADGVMEFGGRSDNQVKIRGHRIELGEIETLIDAQPGVSRSVVIATDGPAPELVAYVMPRTDDTTTADPAGLRTAIAAALPDAMVPSAIALVERFPLTPNGKIDRNRLPAITPDGPAPEFVGATNDAEQVVGALWQEQLGVQVGLNDNFFEVGGHSLMAVKMFRELGSEHPGLALTDIFRYPTIRSFAAHLSGLGDGGGNGAAPASAQPAGTDRAELRRRARRGGSRS